MSLKNNKSPYAQLRLLSSFSHFLAPIFVESGNLSQELLNCLDVCDGALKLDIISLLPEIISDAESGNIVEKLKDLMSEVR